MQSSTKPPFNEATPTSIKQRLDAGEQLLIVDVREPYEYQIAHLEGSELRPMSRIQEWWQDLPRDQEVIVMCHHGGRSANVCMALSRAGFTQLTNMTGGIDAWTAEVDPSIPRY